MRKLIVATGVFILFAIFWALPLYLCMNFVLWVFDISYHLTLLQSLGICLLSRVIHSLLFDK